MDPITALGVASSVVQLVDFTQGLIRSTYEIYKSPTGSSEASSDLASIATSLKTLNEDLSQSVRRATVSTGNKPSNTDLELLKLCRNCNGVANKLLSALQKLKTQKSDVWHSFMGALHTVWKEKELSLLRDSLETYQWQISTRVNVSVRSIAYKLINPAVGNSSLHRFKRPKTSAEVFSGGWIRMLGGKPDLLRPFNRGSGIYRIQAGNGIASPVRPLDNFYQDHVEKFRMSIVSQLYYAQMESRSESVKDPYRATFQWIFSLPPTEQNFSTNQNWSNFVHFLESDQSLYWITGKAGSGKSSLMKLIKEDKQTAYHLGKWAGDKALYISGFYFWSAGGDEIQMTQEGLLRTLIHQALRTFPGLAPLMFPGRIETFMVLGYEFAWEESLTFMELLLAFKLFIREATKTNKIFLLIDGLDEFNGAYSQQIDVIESLQSYLSSDCKLCVSSRPWNVFQDAFSTHPSLRLEDLTYNDMQHYCSSRLLSNLGFVALQSGDPESASELIDNVAAKSCGVFLWVILVVQSLLEGLTDGERLSDLQKRLDSLPSDLETLFWRILKSVDFERISQLIQIVQASPSNITIIKLSFADEEDPDCIFKLPTKPLPWGIISSRAEIMRRRLNACCKGLLEPQGNDAKENPRARVGYLHRTVKDFVQKSDVWQKLLEATSPSFDPHMRASAALICHLKILPTNSIACTERKEYGDETRRIDGFWPEVFNCISITLTSWSTFSELKLRLLKEIRNVVDEIMNRNLRTQDFGATNYEMIRYATCPASPNGKARIDSFLQLMIQFQDLTYINSHINELQGRNRVAKLSLLLRFAVTEYAWEYGGFLFTEPSIPIVETLLQHGATFDDDLWNGLLKDNTRNSELFILLLNYGANPYACGLDPAHINLKVIELARIKRKEDARKRGASRSNMKGAMLETTKAIDDTTPSRWSRSLSKVFKYGRS